MTATAATTSVGAHPGAQPRLRLRFREWLPVLRYCAGVYLTVRVALLFIGAAAWGLTGESALPAYAAPHNGWHNALTGWIKLDSGYFLRIARYGYQSRFNTASFYPGYPFLIRAASYLTFGHLKAAGLLVSNGALVAALIVIYRLTQREYDEPTARRAVLYLCLFPTAFFLFDIYSESVYLVAAVGALALARRGRWGWAGLAGLGASLTRSMGAVIALALMAEAIQQTVENRRQRGDGDTRQRRPALRAALRLVASAVPLAGPVSYLLFWQLRYHNWYEPIRLEKTVWGRQFTLPWVTLARGVSLAVKYLTSAGNGWLALDLALVIVGLALGAWVAFRTRPIYAVYTWASIAFFLMDSQRDRPLVSDGRYLVTVFPLMWALGRMGQRPRVHEAIVVVSAASLAIVGWLFLSTYKFY